MIYEIVKVQSSKGQIIFITFTPASIAGYLAPQDNYHGWLLKPPECETKLSSKYFGMGYVKMHAFHGNP